MPQPKSPPLLGWYLVNTNFTGKSGIFLLNNIYVYTFYYGRLLSPHPYVFALIFSVLFEALLCWFWLWVSDQISFNFYIMIRLLLLFGIWVFVGFEKKIVCRKKWLYLLGVRPKFSKRIFDFLFLILFCKTCALLLL